MQFNGELSLGAMPEDAIFALDIGTRTIIGVVGVKKDDNYYIHDAEIVVHESRAMMDGQIHDIDKVAQGALKVKNALEKRLGYSLNKVSIAAAGRVLKTSQIKVERAIEEGKEIDPQLISALEMESIQKAQFEIEKNLDVNDRNQFYCVGYSVVTYYLNDYIISSLVGHKGHKAGVEVLATFLPQTVVDSLYTVMERVGIEVKFLTLEPIAALNLSIPKDLRLLNLALVDVGAGTSDIAITKSGTIIAYAMVPIAGDEVTEAIAQNYLVDFETAENIKITLSKGESNISFTDILDNEVSVKSDEIKAVTKPVIENLARITSEKILELNGGKPPNAIFLVGGGSQSSGLCDEISDTIGLPKQRVAVKNRSIAKNIITDMGILDGPESITPLGILVTTSVTKGQDFFYVTVNNNKIRMYNSRKMLVSDALILAGFNPDDLICKSGKSIKVIVNGNERTIRGGMGKPAELYVNDELSSLNAYIRPGDNLRVIPAENGRDGFAVAQDFIESSEPIHLKYGDNTQKIEPKIVINGSETTPNTPVQSGDKVDIINEYKLLEIAKLFEMDSLAWDFTVNGESAKMERVVKPGEHIVGTPRKYTEQVQATSQPTAEEQAENEKEINKQINIQDILRDVEQKIAQRDGINVIINDKPVKLPPKKVDYLFIDIFNHIDFDLSSPKGMIALILNGKEANYTDKIKSGDIIKVYWQE